ncbi:porin [Kiritimatiellaeota bacterium B1221]|nr:porin [Kiritimatiellaeota bacterium B1221]
MKKKIAILSAIVASGTMMTAQAGGYKIKSEDGESYLKIGGRIQLQYHSVSPDEGDSTDELFFRRLRPYIEGSLYKDWKAKFQFDMGKSKTEIKDMYFQYKGYDFGNVTLGNKTFPFSREQLTSSKKQGVVERTFVGDHNYGSPDRQVGIYLDGGSDMLTYGLGLAMGAIDTSNSKLDFDTVASLNKGDDWNEGPMFGGRVEIHPMGAIKFSQGALSGEEEFKASFGIGAFSWSNDEDEMALDDEGAVANDNVDSVTGIEISGAVRVAGLSMDIQYNTFDSETTVAGTNSGIYKDGSTTLETFAIEGGYTVVPELVELVAAYSSMDADGYDETWTRTELGVNYYVHKHDVKYQLTYRMNADQDGEADNDVDELFVQAQFVF